MKGVISTAVAVFFGISAVFPPLASAESVADQLGLKINGGGTIILQGTPKTNDGSDKGLNDASYTFDFVAEKDFENGGRARIHFEGGAGRGLGASARTYSSMNADADPTVEPNINNSLVKITELWYQQAVLDGKLTFTFGKLNNGSYFDTNAYANDETSQFLTSAFVSNQIVRYHDRNVALRVSYAPADIIDITYGYFAAGMDNFDTGPFNILQVNVKPFENGNYRFYCWANSSDNGKYRTDKDNAGAGFGLSFDQALNETLGLFARFGYSDPEIYERSLEWSFGAQVKGNAWNRENDKLGAAVGQIANSSKWADFTNGKKGSETQAELYYSYCVGKNLAITPVVQYFANPAAGNAAASADVFVYGIRTQISF